MLLDKFKAILDWTHHNQRNIETGKTVLLWVLVVSSLLLTWSLWTYNPALDPLKEQGAVEIKIEPLEGTRKLSEVVRPIQLIYLEDGQNYFAISDNKVRQNLYNKLLESIMINPNDLKPSEINGEIDPDNFIEFVYPTNLSRDIIEHIFNLKNRQLIISDFDRVYLFQKDINDVKKNYLRLISYGENSFVDLEVQLDYQYFKEKMENKNIRKQYFNHVVRNKSGETEGVIYLPAEKEIVDHPIMVVQQKIAPEDFKVALFNDPSSVNRENSNNNIYYSDDKQVLSISTDSNEMSYRSFITDIGNQIPDFERVKKSIDFVNNHYGWTDQYVLFGEYNDVNKTFRLMVDGIPVLNNLGMIQIRWEKGQIYEYNRSLINFSYEYQRNINIENIKEKDSKKWPSLMSGYELLNILEDANKLTTVKDIKIGYSMDKYNKSNIFYEFTPHWYYFNGENWNRIENLVGGDLDGLEEN